ncbi:polyhydroxyalkanoate granule-associated phasin [Variovorax paradoxus]|uniref:polyhydroxyalkanoate granule-associated phasin n=1 Tax=Variovorax paradoxus TaxID=34073 RepID=UPI003D6578CF
MSSLTSAVRLASPLMLWVDVALKTHEMLLSSGSVIQMRTERIAKAGLTPSAADLAEFQLMGNEKLAAAGESSVAMAKQWHSSHVALANRALQQWFQSAGAFLSMTGSITPAQAAVRSDAFVRAAARAAGTASQLSGAAVRIARQGLKPIHAAATSNARRLAELRD